MYRTVKMQVEYELDTSFINNSVSVTFAVPIFLTQSSLSFTGLCICIFIKSMKN